MAKFNVTTNATEEGLWRQTCSMKGLSPLSLNVPMFSYSWTKLENSRWKKLKNSIYVVYIIFFTCGQDPPCASDFILHILLLRTGSSPKPASCKTYVAKIIHPLLCQITGCNTLTSSKCFKIAYFFRKIVLQWEMEDSVSFVKAFDQWKFCLQVS